MVLAGLAWFREVQCAFWRFGSYFPRMIADVPRAALLVNLFCTFARNASGQKQIRSKGMRR